MNYLWSFCQWIFISFIFFFFLHKKASISLNMIFLCNRITWWCCIVGACNCKTDFACSIWLYWVYNKTMVKSQVLYIVCIPNYLAAFLFKCLWESSIRIYRVVTLFWFLEHLRGAYLECIACSDGYKKEQHQVHGFLLLYRRKKKFCKSTCSVNCLS